MPEKPGYLTLKQSIIVKELEEKKFERRQNKLKSYFGIFEEYERQNEQSQKNKTSSITKVGDSTQEPANVTQTYDTGYN